MLHLGAGVLNALVIRSTPTIAAVPLLCRGVPEKEGVRHSTGVCKTATQEECVGIVGHDCGPPPWEGLFSFTALHILNVLMEPSGEGLPNLRAPPLDSAD